MRCTGGGMPGAMTSTVVGRYGPQSLDVRMRHEASGQPNGADAVVETRIVGRRIGDCPAGDGTLREGARR
jgi:hypothetical protein